MGVIQYGAAAKMHASSLIMLIFCATLLPVMHAGYAQTPAKFSIKGAVSESSNFHGVIMWTIVDGNKGTIFLQSPVGRGIVHVSLSPSTTCDSSTPICLFSTVIDTTDSKAFKVGDTARFSINLDSKQESVSLLSGTLAGFDVTVSLSQRRGSKILCPLQQLRLSTPLQLQILPLSIAQTMEASWISEQRLRDKQESMYFPTDQSVTSGAISGESARLQVQVQIPLQTLLLHDTLQLS